MNKARTAAAALTAVLALGALSACGDNDTLEGSDRQKAEDAALAETGGGEVTEAEKADEDEDHAYDVQVAMENGDEVDVELDEEFSVVRTDVDTNDANDTTGGDTGNDTGNDTGDDTGSDDTGTQESPAVDPDDAPLTGQTLQRASKAAIAAAGGGQVTDSSISDDPTHAYDVEVTLDNGDEVDVDLDERFNLVNKELDPAGS